MGRQVWAMRSDLITSCPSRSTYHRPIEDWLPTTFHPSFRSLNYYQYLNDSSILRLRTFGLLRSWPYLIPEFLRFKCELPCLTFPRFAVGVKHYLTGVQLSIIRKAPIAEAVRPCFWNAIVTAHTPLPDIFCRSAASHDSDPYTI